jgi:hypothetical protein
MDVDVEYPSMEINHPEPIQDPMSDVRSDHTPEPPTTQDELCIERYPGPHAVVYEPGETFMDKFDKDTHASKRSINLFYPFKSKKEWELASFLLQSRMSMVEIDRFLGLTMVSILHT